MAKPLFINGKPVFKDGKPVFIVNGQPCICCDGVPVPLVCCDGRQIRQLTLTLGGFEDWDCHICLWVTHEACAPYVPADEVWYSTLTNLHGTYTLDRDDSDLSSNFAVYLGTQGDEGDPGVLIAEQINATTGATRQRYVWKIGVNFICSEIYGAVATVNYYVQRRIPGYGFSNGYDLGCAFGSLTCGDFSYLSYPAMVGIVEADSLEDVCNGEPMTGEAEDSASGPYCFFDYTATASVVIPGA